MKRDLFRPVTLMGPGVVVFLFGFILAASAAADWPQWRGPNRDGIWNETGILRAFPADGLKIRWRAPIGNGFSSPVIAKSRVYVTDSVVTKTNMFENVHCLDEATGKTVWKHTDPVVYPEWGADPAHPFGPIATPVVVDGKIYSFGRMSHLFCLDAEDGRVLWMHDLPREFQTEEDLRGPNCSLLVEGKLIIVPIAKSPTISVIAFDKDTGRQVWESLDEIPSNSSPIAITVGGRRQIVVWAYQSVAALDPANGQIIWRHPVNTGPTYTVATPVWKDEYLLLGGLMLRLHGGKPTVLWPDEPKPSRVHISDTSTALILNNLIFAPTSRGEILCLDPLTGKEHWKAEKITEPKGGASIHLTAAPSIGCVFLFTDRGDLILSRLSHEGYQELSRTHLLEPTNDNGARKMAWTPPAYANQSIFARNDKEIICASLAEEASK